MSVNSVGLSSKIALTKVIVETNGQRQQFDVLPGTKLKIKNDSGNVQVSSKPLRSSPIESLGHAVKARLGL